MLTEKTRLAAVIAKTETLKAQVLEIQKQVGQFTEVRTQIAQLERKKEVDEKNYMYFESSLEKARIDEALDPSKMPNISVVQKPSLALKASMGVFKVMFVLAAGVFGLGLVYAAVTELVLNRSVKGSVELEKILKAPVLARIPDFATKVKARRPVQKEGEGAAAASPNLALKKRMHLRVALIHIDQEHLAIAGVRKR